MSLEKIMGSQEGKVRKRRVCHHSIPAFTVNPCPGFLLVLPWKCNNSGNSSSNSNNNSNINSNSNSNSNIKTKQNSDNNKNSNTKQLNRKELQSCQGENLVFWLGKILFHAPLLETKLHHILMKYECWNWHRIRDSEQEMLLDYC